MMSATNVISNGSFEADPLPSGLNWDAFEFVTAWQVHSTNGAKAEIQSISPRSGSNNGRQYLELDGDENGHPNRFNESPDDFRAPITGRAERGLYAVSQSFPTEADHSYDLYFDVKARDGRPAEDNRLKVIITDAHDDSVIFQEEIQAGAAWETLDYTFTAESENTRIRFEGLGPDNTFGAYLDDVRAYDQDETPDFDIIVPNLASADDSSMRVAFSVKLPEEADDEDVDNWDGEDVTFKLYDPSGVKAEYTETILGGLAYATFGIPSHIAGSTYWVTAEFDDTTQTSTSWQVIPGSAATITPTLKLNGVPYSTLPPLENHRNKTLSIELKVTDAHNNLVADDTPVTWDDAGGARAGAMTWGGGTGVGSTDVGKTIAGKAYLNINTNDVPGLYKLSVAADTVTSTFWVVGGEVNVTVTPSSRNIMLDNLMVIQLTANVSLVSGGPAPNGTSVTFWDSRGWVGKKTATTTNGVARSWITVPSGTEIGAHLEGKLYYTASVLGTYANVPSYDFIDVGWFGAPPTIKLSNSMLAGDATGTGTASVQTPTGDTVTASWSSSTQVRAFRLEPGREYRISENDPANLTSLRHNGAYVTEIVFTADASTVFDAELVTAGNIANSIGRASVLLEQKNLLGFWTSVGLSGTSHAIVAPTTWIPSFKQFSAVSSDVLWGAVTGNVDSWAGLAGDIGFSLIPVVGVYTDIRDVSINLMQRYASDFLATYAPSLYGEPDDLELALGVVGIVTEFLPPVDYVADGFRSAYKLLKVGLNLGPFAATITPLLVPAAREYVNYLLNPPATIASAGDSISSVSATSVRSVAASVSSSIDDLVAAMMGIGPNCRKIANFTGLTKLAKADSQLTDILRQVAKEAGDDFGQAMLKAVDLAGYQKFADALKAASAGLGGAESAAKHLKTAIETLAVDSTAVRNLVKNTDDLGSIMTKLGSIAQKRDGAQIAAKLKDAMKAIGDKSGSMTTEGWKNILGDIDELASHVSTSDLSAALGQVAGAAKFSDFARFRGRMYEISAAAELARQGVTGLKLNVNVMEVVDGVRRKATDLDVFSTATNVAYEMKSGISFLSDPTAVIKKIVNYGSAQPAKMVFVVETDAHASAVEAFLNTKAAKRAVNKLQQRDPGFLVEVLTIKGRYNL